MTFELRRIVDLSHPINAETQVYPGDPVPELSPATTIDRDGYNVLHVSMGSQTGTHVDAPYHFLADGARIDAMDLLDVRWPCDGGRCAGARAALDDLLGRSSSRPSRRWSAGRSLSCTPVGPGIGARRPTWTIPTSGRTPPKALWRLVSERWPSTR